MDPLHTSIFFLTASSTITIILGQLNSSEKNSFGKTGLYFFSRAFAFSLGAKSYTVELEESSTKERIATKKAFEKVDLPIGTSKKKAESSADSSSESKETISKKVLKKATFTNGATPVQPELKWFKYDDEMTNLIKMRLSGQINDNSMRDYSISLEGSAYSSIGASTAAKIDAAVSKLESGAGYNISNQEKQESKKKLVFKIQF